MAAKKYKLSNGELKDDDSKPIKAGESAFSDPIWTKLKVRHGNEKNVLSKLKATDKRAKK